MRDPEAEYGVSSTVPRNSQVWPSVAAVVQQLKEPAVESRQGDDDEDHLQQHERQDSEGADEGDLDRDRRLCAAREVPGRS